MSRTQRAFFPGHWAWALPILLIVAVLSIRQIDLYSPSGDERYSIAAAGFFSAGHSLLEVAQFVLEFPDGQTPGYFLLLNVWGNFTSSDTAILRVFSIYVGMLTLAMAYRLGYDFIDPRAGIVILTLVACNAYFNYTYVHMRMYGCAVLTSAIALWLYMRMTFDHRGATVRRSFALFAALFALLMFHVLSTFFLVSMLIGYHTLFVRKDRRWLAFPAAIAGALALASPYIANIYRDVLAHSLLDRAAQNTLSMTLISPVEFIRAGLSVVLNSSYAAGQLALIALPLAGIALATANSRARQPQLRMLLLSVLGLAVVSFSVGVGLIPTERMRYVAALLLPFLLLIAAGLFALAQQRSWMIVFVAFYVMAGVSHHSSGDSDLYVTYGWRRAITQAPLHTISRLAVQSESRPLVIGFQQIPNWIEMRFPNYGFSSFEEHYFARHGIQVEVIFESREAQEYINGKSPPDIWVFHQASVIPPDIDELDSLLRDNGYRLQQSVETGKDTLIRQYSRRARSPGQ